MRPSLLRVAAGGATLALAVAALSGCSAAGSASCTPQASGGQQSETVTAASRFGARPTVAFPSPLHATSTQVSTLIAGHGAPITATQQVVADLTFLNGTSGQVVTRTEYTGTAAAAKFVIDQIGVPGLTAGLTCARVGERLAVVVPPAEGIPADRRPAGLDGNDTLVAVVDVRQAYLARANGTDQVMGSGLPAVVLAADGRPGITLPEEDPPTRLTVADLQKGSGAVVKKGDDVVVHYTGVVWKPGDLANGSVFDSSWAKGAPATFPVKDGQIVKGLVTALTGQRVGSQVLAVLPASQAYGSEATSSVPANATLVFVVDILGKA